MAVDPFGPREARNVLDTDAVKIANVPAAAE